MRKPELGPLTAILFLSLGSCSPATVPVHLAFRPMQERSAEPVTGAPHLHAVTTIFGGQIPVFVGPSKKPQAIYLASFYPTVWHVYLLPGARISKIYFSGFDPQHVIVHRSRLDWFGRLPQMIDLGDNPGGHPTLSLGTPPISPEGAKAAAYMAALKARIGLEITDFHGREYMRPDEAVALSMSRPSDAQIRAHFPKALRRRVKPADAELQDVREDIAALIARGDLPKDLPIFDNKDPLDPGEAKFWSVLPDAPPTRGLPADGECGRVQLGTADDDALWCDKGTWTEGRTRWIIAGGGSDILSDSHYNSQVMSGGGGNDIIAADLGNDVLYFGRGWGRDVVAIRCTADTEAYRQAALPEPLHMNSRYVVFGRGVRPSDLVWISKNEIEHTPTRSHIRFVDKPCAKFIAVEPGAVPLPPIE